MFKQLFLLILFACIFSFSPLQAQNRLNLTDEGTALHGYDPVSYHHHAPRQGKEQYAFRFREARYLFANAENLAAFRQNPLRYQPAFGGWCAWAMLEGEKVDVNPERYKLIGGKTYLFYTSFFTDTLKKWNAMAEETPETDMVKQALEQWQAVQ